MLVVHYQVFCKSKCMSLISQISIAIYLHMLCDWLWGIVCDFGNQGKLQWPWYSKMTIITRGFCVWARHNDKYIGMPSSSVNARGALLGGEHHLLLGLWTEHWEAEFCPMTHVLGCFETMPAGISAVNVWLHMQGILVKLVLRGTELQGYEGCDRHCGNADTVLCPHTGCSAQCTPFKL